MEEVIELLNELIDYVKVHYYRKRIQEATYREHTKGLKDGEFVIHVNYSENCKNKQQSEIKAGYFGLSNFILLTMQAVYDTKTVKFWSDGRGSQFNSQFAFFMLSKFDNSINLEWNYFEGNHGKGAVDGVGGTAKHTVYSHVLTTGLSSNPQSSLSSMQVKYCQKVLFSIWRMNP